MTTDRPMQVDAHAGDSAQCDCDECTMRDPKRRRPNVLGGASVLLPLKLMSGTMMTTFRASMFGENPEPLPPVIRCTNEQLFAAARAAVLDAMKWDECGQENDPRDVQAMVDEVVRWAVDECVGWLEALDDGWESNQVGMLLLFATTGVGLGQRLRDGPMKMAAMVDPVLGSGALFEWMARDWMAERMYGPKWSERAMDELRPTLRNPNARMARS